MATFQGLYSTEVNLSLATSAGTSASFNIPLVVLPHNLNTARLTAFASTTSVSDLGAATNSPLYRYVAGFFSGNFPSSLIKVARANLLDIDITVGDNIPALGEDISVNVNVDGTAVVVSHTMTGTETDADTTATALAAALTTAFPVGGGNPTFSATGPVVTVVPDTLSVSVGWNSIDEDGVPHTSIVDTTSEDLVTVIDTATSVDNDYYFLMAESRESADVVKLADYAVANDKQYFTSTGDSEVADNADTDNIAITLGDKSQDNVALMYLTADKYYFPESTLVGGMAAIEPYVLFNPNFMTLSGIPIDYLTETQIVTLTQRNTSFYVSERGYSVYKSGWTMGGNFVDTIRNANWAKVRIEEVLTALLKEKANLGSALPYTDVGAAMMGSRVKTQVIDVGIRGGSIATGSTTDSETGSVINLNPIINFGTRAQQTNANIANRVWADASVEYVYVSGINNIKVNLNVILNRDPE
ncbi:tail sheath [Vibrio phage PWH3a-P1]|uniref:tail sheath n=1 Tax=Vibrio phage PWH3a-P1 TaxID=754058 RepID=UPI0002C0CF22|nr:tail sheath [Vibrio phage PWH3a-P1]AGH32050.1 hypothetical protein VPIG_00194 [Vibrio phage PWH3a-P1]